MKATNFLLDPPALAGLWARRKPAKDASAKPLTLLQRFDRWLWLQQVREREAYLSQPRALGRQPLLLINELTTELSEAAQRIPGAQCVQNIPRANAAASPAPAQARITGITPTL